MTDTEVFLVLECNDEVPGSAEALRILIRDMTDYKLIFTKLDETITNWGNLLNYKALYRSTALLM